MVPTALAIVSAKRTGKLSTAAVQEQHQHDPSLCMVLQLFHPGEACDKT